MSPKNKPAWKSETIKEGILVNGKPITTPKKKSYKKTTNK